MNPETTLFDTEEATVKGKVLAIFFENPSNFYKVVLLEVKESEPSLAEPEIVVTGNFGDLHEGEAYQFFGEVVEHPKYGRQFQALRYRQVQPTSAEGVVDYLASDKFPGIGKKTAETIVETLGIDAIDKILAEPACLAKIPRFTAKKRQMLVETLRQNYGMEKIIIQLNQYGFSAQLAFAIYQVYKEDTLEVVQKHPYQLVEDVEGIGFKKADDLAENLGIDARSPERIRAAIQYELPHLCMDSGDTYVEAETLLANSLEILEKARAVEIPRETAAQMILELAEEGKLQEEETRLFDNSLYFAEIGIAGAIERLQKTQSTHDYTKQELQLKIDEIEKKARLSYGASQRDAIEKAAKSPLFLLTGGPGTGKTTVIDGIVRLYAALNDVSLRPEDYTDEPFPILLAAPTGRAAKRLNETTGLPASTIHRLLGLTGQEKDPVESAQEIDGGLLIIDEFSMVDTWLANALFQAIPSKMQVILVGDKDQLPSVGPGQVLHDLLTVSTIPHKELTEIYRQKEGSTIITLAHEIRQGRLPKNFRQNQADRSYFPAHGAQIEPLIRQIVEKAQKKGFTAQQIQVLAPMYRGPAGIDALNQMLQEIFNGNPTGQKKEVADRKWKYRINDKVLQLVNAPELNVFNGDMGVITGITLAKDSEQKVDELTILFDGGEVTYPRNEWYKITLAYACSIHKAQGSEFEMVILPMVRQYHRMLQRNLLYTAITRSKKILIMLGELDAFEACVQNESANRRTRLAARLGEEEKKEKSVGSEEAPDAIIEEEKPDYRLTKVKIAAGIDPLIGMNGLTPLDFQN